MNDKISVPQPISTTAVLESKFLPSPLIKKPIKGNNGIKKTNLLILTINKCQIIKRHIFKTNVSTYSEN